MLSQVAAIALFAAVLVLVLWQPRGLPVAWTTTIGALLALITGLVTLHSAGLVIAGVWDATLAFVGIVVLSVLMDQAGVFVWAAWRMQSLARGSGRALFFGIVLLGATVSALFTNDGAALILTPIVVAQARALRLPMKTVVAYVMAAGFVADATSIPLMTSNLVNIIAADSFHMGFLTYAARLGPVDLVAIAASLAALWWYYRLSVPAHVDMPERPTIADPRLFKLVWPMLALLAAGFVLSELLHFPVSLSVLSVALLFTLLALRSPAVSVSYALRRGPWRIVVFSIGMYVIVYALSEAGLVQLLAEALQAGAHANAVLGIVLAGVLTAVLSSVVNNLPAVLMATLALHNPLVGAAHRVPLTLAAIIGCDLGTKMTPIGSLATLLWLHVLEERGIRIAWGTYIKAGLVLTAPVLLVTLLGLALWLQVMPPALPLR